MNKLLRDFSDEEFIATFHKAKSVRHLLSTLGVKCHGETYRTVERRCQRLGLNYSSKVTWKKTNRDSSKLTNEQVFCFDSVVARSTVRRWILSENLLPYECAICGMPPIWNNNPLVLILDHINGRSNDNRLINLRFVCGNCDLQLDTFKGRNKR